MDHIGSLVIQGGALAILGYYFLRVQPALLERWTNVVGQNAAAMSQLTQVVEAMDGRWSCSKSDCELRTPLAMPPVAPTKQIVSPNPAAKVP